MTSPALAVTAGVEQLTTGNPPGPVTVFVHGLAGSIEQTRPFGSGVHGLRVFAHLRGHGGTPVPRDEGGRPRPGGYPELADEVDALARATGATRALGVSLGAGTVLNLLARRPARFERVVLCLPPPEPPDRPDTPGADRFGALAEAIEAMDVEALARLLREQQPAAVRGRPAVAVWARRHAAEIVARAAAGSALAAVVRAVGGASPLVDRAAADALGAVRAPVLVLAQHDDELHPARAARWWADAIPGARLEVLAAGSFLWSGRERVRQLVAEFLNA